MFRQIKITQPESYDNAYIDVEAYKEKIAKMLGYDKEQVIMHDSEKKLEQEMKNFASSDFKKYAYDCAKIKLNGTHLYGGYIDELKD